MGFGDTYCRRKHQGRRQLFWSTNCKTSHWKSIDYNNDTINTPLNSASHRLKVDGWAGCLWLFRQLSVPLDLLPDARCNPGNNRRGTVSLQLYSFHEKIVIYLRTCPQKRTKGKLGHLYMDKERAQHQVSVMWLSLPRTESFPGSGANLQS